MQFEFGIYEWFYVSKSHESELVRILGRLEAMNEPPLESPLGFPLRPSKNSEE